LKLVLEHREVSNWQKLVEHLLSDKEMLAGVRLKFRDLYREIEGSSDPSAALEALLGSFRRRRRRISGEAVGRCRLHRSLRQAQGRLFASLRMTN
jgi:hypothetical protein